MKSYNGNDAVLERDACTADIAGNYVTIGGRFLTLREVVAVAKGGSNLIITSDEKVLQRVQASQELIQRLVEENRPIYGVTTGFGGMAGKAVAKEQAELLQNNLLFFLKSGAGARLREEFVRASMVIRANALLVGVSGIRYDIIERFQIYLNRGITPHVYELGSIGASGDLVPLSAIAGCLIGLNEDFKVDFRNEERSAVSVLEEIGLPRMRLLPKEGLALVNGTAVMSGIAACCTWKLQRLVVLSLGVHALHLQALQASVQPFDAFVHRHKPHPGQQWVAETMRCLLEGSLLVKNEQTQRKQGELIQDRYSVRCLPQFIGPIIENLAEITRKVEIEINSATDNPLVDTESERVINGGNFLGEHIGMSMDQARAGIGLLAKHLDAQISLLAAPEFSNGLPPSLIGNSERAVNMGLKGLQLTGNSIMPMLTFLGNPFVSHFPTHAEQFNQNINSLGMGAANLTNQAIELFESYLAVALLFGVQGVDLRARSIAGTCDPRSHLSPDSLKLYEATREVIGRAPTEDRPLIYNDDEQSFDGYIRNIVNDLRGEGRILESITLTHQSFEDFTQWGVGN